MGREINKKPYGPGSKYSYTSKGGEVKMNDFYHTRYLNEFGIEAYQPRKGGPIGTGFASNIRPHISYKSTLDQLDNPYMANWCKGNYQSETMKNFKWSEQGSNGKDHFPSAPFRSGYVCDWSGWGLRNQHPSTVPLHQHVMDVHWNTRNYGGESRPGLQPNQPIHLRKIQRKDTTQLDNHNYGPSFMKTEANARFKGEQIKVEHVAKNELKVDVGKQTDGGWVANKHREPVTFTAERQYNSNNNFHSQGVGKSVTSEDYKEYKDKCGRELLPHITPYSTRVTGFIRGPSLAPPNSQDKNGFTKLEVYPKILADQVKKNDPSDFTNLKYPHNNVTTIQTQYQGAQRNEGTKAFMLGKEMIGLKEASGNKLNNLVYVPTTIATNYNTNYVTSFPDKRPVGVERMGHIRGNVQPIIHDGFTRSSNLHSYGRHEHMNRTLYQLDPFVSRTIKFEDEFYGNDIHRNKATDKSKDNYYKVDPISTATLQPAC